MNPRPIPSSSCSCAASRCRARSTAPSWSGVSSTPRRSSRPRWLPAGRTALAGAVGAVGLAATFALLGLAGSGPLSGDDSDVRAKDPCRYVTTLGPTRTPYVVELADGSIEIRFRRERAEQLVKRCR